MKPMTKARVDKLFKKMKEKEILAAMADFYNRHHRPATKEELVRYYL